MNKKEIELYKSALAEIKSLKQANLDLKEKYLKSEQENVKLERELLELREIATKDELTSLLNRRALTTTKDKYEAVVLGDIDFFKKINDNYGHDVGDVVLKKVAQILQSSIRDDDLAIRWGGEEFVLLLKNCSEEDAIKKANEIREKIQNSGFEFPTTMSFGVTFHKEAPLQDAVKEADLALYYSKEHGRNQVTSYNSLQRNNEITNKVLEKTR